MSENINSDTLLEELIISLNSADAQVQRARMLLLSYVDDMKKINDQIKKESQQSDVKRETSIADNERKVDIEALLKAIEEEDEE